MATEKVLKIEKIRKTVNKHTYQIQMQIIAKQTERD
jgi:hypothetical protein